MAMDWLKSMSIGSDVRSEKSRSSEYDFMPPAPSLSFHIEVS